MYILEKEVTEIFVAKCFQENISDFDFQFLFLYRESITYLASWKKTLLNNKPTQFIYYISESSRSYLYL